MTAYEANPDTFEGNVSHTAEVVRFEPTRPGITPDLWTIVHILGGELMKVTYSIIWRNPVNETMRLPVGREDAMAYAVMRHYLPRYGLCA
jgi:hypothetical protein